MSIDHVFTVVQVIAAFVLFTIATIHIVNIATCLERIARALEKEKRP